MILMVASYYRKDEEQNKSRTSYGSTQPQKSTARGTKEENIDTGHHQEAGPKVSPSARGIWMAVPAASMVFWAILVPHQSGKEVCVRFRVRKIRMVHSARPTSRPADST